MTPAILCALALAAEPVERAAGLTLGVNAWQSPARHVLMATPGLWVMRSERPWSLAGELSYGYRARETELYAVDTHYARAAALGGLALGTRPATFHAELGLALSAQRSAVRLDDATRAAIIAEPGLRVRTSLDGPIGERFAWQGLIGVTSRGVYDWDYDMALGVGMRW